MRCVASSDACYAEAPVRCGPQSSRCDDPTATYWPRLRYQGLRFAALKRGPGAKEHRVGRYSEASDVHLRQVILVLHSGAIASIFMGMSSAARVRAEALNLSEDERLELAEDLVASVHAHPDPAWEAALLAECDRRMADLDYGKSKGIPWDEVKAELDARFGRR